MIDSCVQVLKRVFSFDVCHFDTGGPLAFNIKGVGAKNVLNLTNMSHLVNCILYPYICCEDLGNSRGECFKIIGNSRGRRFKTLEIPGRGNLGLNSRGRDSILPANPKGGWCV